MHALNGTMRVSIHSPAVRAGKPVTVRQACAVRALPRSRRSRLGAARASLTALCDTTGCLHRSRTTRPRAVQLLSTTIVPVQHVPAAAAVTAAAAAQPASSPDSRRSVTCRSYSSAAFSGSPRSSSSGMGAGSSSMSLALSSTDGGSMLKAKGETPKTCRVRFWLKFHVDYGQTIKIIGSQQDLGGWNLSQAPEMKWSEGDLWNISMELQCGGVYEYKYVVVDTASGTATSWQLGGNNVLGLQLADSEVEVYDSWKNSPGAMVLADGVETTREKKLLSWAHDMNQQRTELRRTRMELAQAREEIRVLRAELSVLRMEATEAAMARAEAEAKQVELLRENSHLRAQVEASTSAARNTMEQAVRLLSTISDDDTVHQQRPGSNSSASSSSPNSSRASSSRGGSSRGTTRNGGGGGNGQPVNATAGGQRYGSSNGNGNYSYYNSATNAYNSGDSSSPSPVGAGVVGSAYAGGSADGAGGSGVFGGLFGFRAPQASTASSSSSSRGGGGGGSNHNDWRVGRTPTATATAASGSVAAAVAAADAASTQFTPSMRSTRSTPPPAAASPAPRRRPAPPPLQQQQQQQQVQQPAVVAVPAVQQQQQDNPPQTPPQPQTPQPTVVPPTGTRFAAYYNRAPAAGGAPAAPQGSTAAAWRRQSS